MKNNDAVVLKIIAHTDNIGADENNQKLSEKRGKAVRTFLLTKGLPDSLMQIAVYGEALPVADNNTVAGRQQNRRATIEFMQKKKKVVPKKPETKMGFIAGNIVDKKTAKGIQASVVIHGKTFRDSILTNDKGYFKKEVPENTVIGLDVFAPGYFFESRMMKIGTADFPTIEVELPPADVGAVAEIKNFYFHGNQAVLLKTSEPELPKLLRFMEINKDLKIEIGGHINFPLYNARGPGEFEQTLSDNRAGMVKAFLVKNGIAEDRVIAIGYCNKQMKFPMARKEEEMAKNRRVEIKVME